MGRQARRHGARRGFWPSSRVQLLSLFLVVADMVLKPTSDDPWTLVVLAAILLAAAAIGAWTVRKAPRDAAPVAESR